MCCLQSSLHHHMATAKCYALQHTYNKCQQQVSSPCLNSKRRPTIGQRPQYSQELQPSILFRELLKRPIPRGNIVPPLISWPGHQHLQEQQLGRLKAGFNQDQIL